MSTVTEIIWNGTMITVNPSTNETTIWITGIRK